MRNLVEAVKPASPSREWRAGTVPSAVPDAEAGARAETDRNLETQP